MENKYYYKVEIKKFTTDNSHYEYKIFSTENAVTNFVRKNKSEKLYYTQGWYATGKIEKILFEDYRYLKESDLREQLRDAQTSKTTEKLYGLRTRRFVNSPAIIVQVSFDKEELTKIAQYLNKFFWSPNAEVVEITEQICEGNWPTKER